MINSYIILNRKTSFISKLFLFIVLSLILLVIWGINTFYYQNYLKLHSQILYFNPNYYLEVLIPVKEVNQITKQNKIIIEDKTYNYSIYKIISDVEYIDNTNYLKILLRIDNLDISYLVNGYQTDIKILKDKKKIIDYFKE
mgnify:CR=1 FL=1